MKTVQYVISKKDNHDKQIYRISDSVGFTDDIMEAEFYTNLEEALLVYYKIRTTYPDLYTLVKVTIQLTELKLPVQELPDKPIPRKPGYSPMDSYTKCEVDPPREPTGPTSRTLTPNW